MRHDYKEHLYFAEGQIENRLLRESHLINTNFLWNQMLQATIEEITY